MALGYLVKRAANGFVVIQEKIVNTPQGPMTNFSVDNDCSWIFPSWDSAQAWIGMQFAAGNRVGDVVSLNPGGPPNAG